MPIRKHLSVWRSARNSLSGRKDVSTPAVTAGQSWALVHLVLYSETVGGLVGDAFVLRQPALGLSKSRLVADVVMSDILPRTSARR